LIYTEILRPPYFTGHNNNFYIPERHPLPAKAEWHDLPR
jgi:hypothetical protein